MAKDEVKSIKMDSDLKKLVNERIENSGMEGSEWLESLMALETIHKIRKEDPMVENDLNDFEKYMNRIHNILIRIYQRGADAAEDIKMNSLEEAAIVSQEMESLRLELSHSQKHLSQKEDELIEVSTAYSELRTKLELFEKTTTTLEDLNRLSNEKINELKNKVADLLQIEQEVLIVKNEVVEQRNLYEQELNMQKEAVTVIRRKNEELEQEIKRKEIEHDSKIAQLKKDYERDLVVIKKELEMTSKETLLREKSSWQELSNERIEQINKEHMNTIAELIERLQSNYKDKKSE